MFDEFLKEAAKPSWWIGVVVVGFLINLTSAYAKPFIDKLLGHFWLSSKQAAEKRQALIIEHAKKLLKSQHLVVELKLDSLTDTLRAVFFAAAGITCFLMIMLSQNDALVPILTYPFDPKSALAIINLALLILGLIFSSFASVMFTKSFDKERIIHAYRKLRKDAELPSEVA